MSRFRPYKFDLLIVAGLLLLPLLLFGEVSIGQRTMIPADNLVQWQPWTSAAAELGVGQPHNTLISDLLIENYAWKRFIQQAVTQREIPLWNPYIFAGAPFLATGQNAAYYPFSLLFIVLPLTKAYGWYTISQLWLAGVLAYVLGRVYGMRRASAAIAGLVYQGAGFMLVSAAVFPMIIGAAAWLPLLLAAIEMVIRNSMTAEGTGKTLPWAALGSVALGCQVLAGHIEITYYTLLVMGFYALWRFVAGVRYNLRPERRSSTRESRFLPLLKPAGWLLSIVVIGLMLGAIQFIPLYEVVQTNFREGSVTLAEVRGWAFPARRAITLLMPDFFGNPSHHGYRDVFNGAWQTLTTNYYGQPNPNGAGTSDWGIKNYVEGGIYLGILPLLLALLGIGSYFAPRPTPGRGSHIGFYVILSFFSLAFIFGTPLYALLYYGLPGINQLHSPFRWVFPLSLGVAVLAGFGMDYLLAPAGANNRRPLARLLAGTAIAGGLLVLLGLLFSWLFYDTLAPLLERIFLGLAKAPEAFPSVRAFYSYQFRNGLILGSMLLGSGLLLWLSRAPAGARRRTFWPILAFGLITLDIFLIGHNFNAAADPALLTYKPALVQWLEAQPGDWRFTTFTPHGDKPFNANVGWFYDFQDVRGYDSIIPKQYTDYMAAIEPQNELLFNRVQPIVHWEALNSPLLDLLGVKYIISSESISLPKLALAWQGEGLYVYENLAAAPRAFTLPQSATQLTGEMLADMARQDPRQFVFVAGNGSFPAGQPPIPGQLTPAEVTAYGNNEVVVAATVTEPAWLVLNDSYFPGWKAYVQPLAEAPAGEDQPPSETEIPVYLVNGNFRGVLLEPGAWSVRFRYSPLSFKLGGLASAMAGIILFFAVIVWGWRRYYHPTGELTNTRSIAKNSVAPTILNLLNRFIDFLFAAFYLRLLGPADAGSYATAIAIAGWFEIISNFGLNTLVIREVSRDRRQASHYLLNTSVVRLGTSLVGSLPIFIYAWLVSQRGTPLGPDTVAAILLLMLGMVLSGLGQSFTGLFYAYETAELPAAIATVTTILKVAFGVIVLLLGMGFVGLAGVSILVNLITLLILAGTTFYKFRLRGPWRLDGRAQGQMLRQSYPLMLNHLLANIFFFVDVPMMQQINGEAAVGWYNSAYKYVNAINVIPSFFTFALFPVISRQIAHSIDDAQRTFRMSVKLMVLISLPLAAVITLLAPLLIGVLGGQQFLPEGAIALRIVIWSIPVGWINSVTNYVLIALGKERVQVRAFLLGVSFNVVANLIFLPYFSFVAASVTTILSEIVLLAVFNIYLRTRMPEIGWGRLLWRPLAVTAAMVAAMWLGLQVHWLLGLGLGLVVYPAGLWLLRIFGAEERRILQSVLPAPLAARLKLAADN